MVTIEFISNIAPDTASINNGKKISAGGDFSSLRKNATSDLYFADCKGSGKKGYFVSADFVDKNNPVFRCNCPSRKLPCKHSLGLLFEMLNKPDSEFVVAEMPEDIVKKREKKEAKKDASAKPKKINKAARIKKMNRQLEGLDIAQKLLSDILAEGIKEFANKTYTEYKAIEKELGNYYLSGVQSYFLEFVYELKLVYTLELKSASTKKQVEITDYYKAVNYLVKLNSLIEKSRVYLNECIETQNVTDNNR